MFVLGGWGHIVMGFGMGGEGREGGREHNQTHRKKPKIEQRREHVCGQLCMGVRKEGTVVSHHVVLLLLWVLLRCWLLCSFLFALSCCGTAMMTNGKKLRTLAGEKTVSTVLRVFAVVHSVHSLLPHSRSRSLPVKVRFKWTGCFARTFCERMRRRRSCSSLYYWSALIVGKVVEAQKREGSFMKIQRTGQGEPKRVRGSHWEWGGWWGGGGELSGK